MVKKKCAAGNCSNSKERNPELSYFRIPKNRCQQWVEALGNERLRNLSTEKLYEKRVCQEHFEESCFLNAQKRLLCHNAVPTKVDKSNEQQPRRQEHTSAGPLPLDRCRCSDEDDPAELQNLQQQPEFGNCVLHACGVDHECSGTSSCPPAKDFNLNGGINSTERGGARQPDEPASGLQQQSFLHNCILHECGIVHECSVPSSTLPPATELVNGNGAGNSTKNGMRNEHNVNPDVILPEPQFTMFSLENVVLGWRDKVPVGAGMQNLGNTCYINCILQALFHVPAFVNWLLGDTEHRGKCEEESGNCLTCSLTKTLLASRTQDIIKPLLITSKLNMINKFFQPGEEEDAHEFLRCLLENVEQEFLRRFPQRMLDPYSRETTPINQIFGGYFRTNVSCRNCGYKSTTFQHFQDIILEIGAVKTIEEALNLYFSDEILDVCTQCKVMLQATKTVSIERPPKVLCLQLKRFTETGVKISKNVEVKVNLNLQKHLDAASQYVPYMPLRYKLTSMATHKGPSAKNGHYIAIAETSSSGYYLFNDASVEQVPITPVFKTDAYIFFFEMEVSCVERENEKTSLSISSDGINVPKVASSDSTIGWSSVSEVGENVSNSSVLEIGDITENCDRSTDAPTNGDNLTTPANFAPTRTSTPIPQVSGHKPKRKVPRLKVPQHQRTPVVKKLLTMYTALNKRFHRLEKKYAAKCMEAKVLKSDKEEAALRVLEDRVSPYFFTLLKCQVRNHTRAPQGRRYNLKEKLMFVSLQRRGPSGFRGLPFVKPTKKTIRSCTSKIEARPGFNDFIFSGLTSRVEDLDPSLRDCSVIIDGIALRTDLEFSEGEDLVKGFVDLGDGDRRHHPADEALTAMVRSLYGTWKQPVCFWFTNAKLTSEDYAPLILELIRRLLLTGLRVRVLITDGLSKQKLAGALLGVTLDNPWFFVGTERIYYAIDIPHLLKCLRNAILKYILKLKDGSLIKMMYLKAFILKDMHMVPRIAPKVGRVHYDPNSFEKMNVRVAAQLLASPVGAGVSAYAAHGALPEDAAATGRWVGEISTFFDSFNGTKETQRKDGDSFRVAATNTSGHRELWLKMKEQMRHWVFLKSRNLTFIDSWIQTINAFLFLLDDLLGEGRKYFPVGHANQDPIENFFSLMRILLGHLHNPSAAEYALSFLTALVKSVTGTGKKKNCKDDDSIVLVHLEALYEEGKREYEERATASAASVPEIDEDNVPEDQEEGVGYDQEFRSAESSYLHTMGNMITVKPIVRKFLSKVVCKRCEAILLSTDTEFQDPHMTGPSQKIIEVTKEVFGLCGNVLPKVLHKRGVLAKLKTEVAKLTTVQLFTLCPDHNGEEKTSLLHQIQVAAVRELVSRTSRALHDKKAKTASLKLQRVSHN